MKHKSVIRGWIAASCSVILLGAGAVLVAPVTANALAGINWSSVWKHQLQPKADKRYYTKATANKTFAPIPHVIRGAYLSQVTVAGAGSSLSADISFGWNLGTAPTVHIIAPGAVAPPGCSGTEAAPGAKPGNLCIFERGHILATTPLVCSATAVCGPGTASSFGALLVATSTGAGVAEISGSWAASPATSVTASRMVVPRTSARSGPVGR